MTVLIHKRCCRWADCQYWEETYDNEAILRSLVEDEIVEQLPQQQQNQKQQQLATAYWDESQRDNHEILTALLREDSPQFAKKRKCTDEDDDDENIVFEAEEEDEDDDLGWNSRGFAVDDDDDKAVDEEDDDSGLCSCESGIFWLSTEDNRLIAESLVAGEQTNSSSMAGTALWEISEFARALVAGSGEHEPAARARRKQRAGKGGKPAAVIGGEKSTAVGGETEDYFQQWRRNLVSPKKTR